MRATLRVPAIFDACHIGDCAGPHTINPMPDDRSTAGADTLFPENAHGPFHDPFRPRRPTPDPVLMTTLPAREAPGHKPMFRRILLPVDGSLSMTPLVATCMAFAAGIGAAVVAVHVIPLPDSADTAPALATQAHAERILQQVADTARTLGVPCECKVLSGAEPWQAIVRAALDYHADLICMSSHGRHGASEHILASQTARVTEHAPLPVLLFR